MPDNKYRLYLNDSSWIYVYVMTADIVLSKHVSSVIGHSG